MTDILESQLNSLLDFDPENKQELIDNYLQSFKVRHNFIHTIVVQWLGLDEAVFLKERQISDIFGDLNDENNSSRYTPDVCFQLKDVKNSVEHGLTSTHWCIVDFSVSTTINLTTKKKEDKYRNISLLLQKNQIHSSVFSFVLSPALSNLEVQVHNFCQFFQVKLKDPFPFLQCRVFFMSLANVQQLLREALRDPDLLMKVLELEYHDKTDNLKRYDTATSTKEHIAIEFIPYFNGQLSTALPTLSMAELTDLMKRLINHEEIKMCMSEIETTPAQIIDSLRHLIKVNDTIYKKQSCPKPSIHILSHTFTNDILEKHNKFSLLEQNQIFDFLHFAKDVIQEDDSFFSFIKDISLEFITMMLHPLYGEFNRSVFETNHCLPIAESERAHEEYHKQRLEYVRRHIKPTSFIDYLRETTVLNIPEEHDSRATRQKMFKVPLSKLKPSSRAIWEKANSGNVRIKKFEDPQRESIDINLGMEFESFMTFLSKPKQINPYTSPIEAFISAKPGNDQSTVFELKETMLSEVDIPLSLVKTTNCYKFMWFQSLIAEQLMHFSQLSVSSNTYSIFTCGNPNQLVLVCNSFHDKGKDVGKAFLCFGLVDDFNWLSKTFGRVYSQEIKILNKSFFLYCTNWRRLTTQKTTFIRDAFYMSLSTSLNAMLRNISEIDQNKFNTDPVFIKHFYTLKCMTTISTSQRIAEMLADMRYAIMSSVAEFSSIQSFLVDKFKGPYKNTFEAWIVQRLKNLADVCTEFKASILVILKQPTFSRNKRQHDSTGGEILIPSIWSRHININLQDFLDDMFLYTHTMKEPSNIHHENIKAVNTILEFQEKYEALSEMRKIGDISTEKGFIDFLTDKNILGFSRSVIHHSVQHLKEELPHKTWEREWSDVKAEYLSEISNTKSVIPEYERQVSIFQKINIKQKMANRRKYPSEQQVHIENPESYFSKEFVDDFKKRMKVTDIIIKRPSRLKTKLSKSLVFQGTNRVKVHDAVTDFIEYHPEINTTYELGVWNMFKNSGRVTADICIKAQYGAKREFYVLNLGAKAMARVLESFFQKICLLTKQEMISIPGDKKMLVMQDVVNSMIYKKKGGQQLFFVNGDCTKWSAAELMECLYVFIHEMKGFIPDEALTYCLNVISLWAKKEITIPISILAQTFIKTPKVNYLKDGEFSLKSTQNFLQGMFNYLSSLKAVCCSSFTYKLWKEMFPESQLQMEHLEHSDDYLHIILATSVEELKRFRLLHRIMMKCHGFNDSVKKTNTQKFLMEFISLCSFNGHMTYPHIKKVKEVGLNLGCTGYRDDMNTVISRIGEAVRVGVPFCNAYIMQRIHQYNLIRAYSLHQGGKNSCGISYTDRFNMPQEMMGIPDLHPIFLFLCKGNPNNYRLSEYASQQRQLKYLLNKEIYLIENSDDKKSNPNNEGLQFYHPFYTFDVENNLIKKIRKRLDMTIEQLEDFWEKHKSYNFIKPNNHNCLLQWLKCMYYRSTFSLAYSRNSRSQITLRLSTFTLNKCLKETMNSDKLFSISDYIQESNSFANEEKYRTFVKDKFTKSEAHQLYIKALLNCDTTVTAIYSLFSNSRIAYKGTHNKYSTASLSPHKLLWLNIDNSPQTLLQYIFNFDDFKLDGRPYRGIASLEADKQKLEEHYQRQLCSNTDIATMKSVFRDLTIAKDKQVLCMSYQTESNTLEGFLKDQLEFNTYHNVRLKLITLGITKALNPHTGEPFYQKTVGFTRDDVRLILDDLGLVYGLLKHGYNCDVTLIKQALNNLIMQSPFENTRINKSMTISEVLMSYTAQTLANLDCTSSEMKTFCFLKAFMTDDPSELELILTEKFSYSYKYITFSGRGDKSRSDKIKEQVTITYNNITYKATLLLNGVIQIHTNKESRAGLLNIYLIAQKLFGMITQYKLEQLLGSTRFKDLPKLHMTDLCNLTQHDKILSTTEHRFIDCVKIEQTMLLHPVIFTKLPIVETNDKRGFQRIQPKFKIDWETSTVYSGVEKIFTLPFLAYRQTNLSSVIGDLRLNGTNLNWWLTHNRIHDFIHGVEVQADNNFFDNLIGFKLSKKSDVSHNLNHLMTFSTKRIPSQIPQSKGSTPTSSASQSPNIAPKSNIIVSTNEKDGHLDENNLQSLVTQLFGNILDDLQPTIQTSLIDELNDGLSSVMEDNLEKLGDVNLGEDLNLDSLILNTNIDIENNKNEDISNLCFDDEILLGFEQSCESTIEVDDFNLEPDEFAFITNEEDVNENKQIDENWEEQQEVEVFSLEKKKNEQGFLTFEEFDLGEANFVLSETTSIKLPQSIRMITGRGDPTEYIINTAYVDKTQIYRLTVSERMALLIMLKSIVEVHGDINDKEKTLVNRLLTVLNDTFKKETEYEWYNDWIVKRVEGVLCGFLKVTNVKDLDLVNRAKQNKRCEVIDNLNGSYDLFIGISQKRVAEWMKNNLKVAKIQSFINIQPLEALYAKCFQQKYHKVLEAYEMLEDLEESE